MHKKRIRNIILGAILITNAAYGYAAEGTAGLSITNTTSPMKNKYPKTITVTGTGPSVTFVAMDEHQDGTMVVTKNFTKVAYYTTGQAPCIAVAFYDKNNHNSGFIHLSNPVKDKFDINDINTKLKKITNTDFNPNNTVIMISPGSTPDVHIIDGVKQWAQTHHYTNIKINAKGNDASVFYIDNAATATLYGVLEWMGTKFYYDGTTSISNLTGIVNTGISPYA